MGAILEDSSNPPSTLGLPFLSWSIEFPSPKERQRTGSPKGIQPLPLDTGGVDATQRSPPKPCQGTGVCESDISKGGEVDLAEVIYVVART